MRIVFMGTPAFAVPTLQNLLDSEYAVAGVVCQPDRPSGRGKRIQMGPVKTLAINHNIPVQQPEKMRDPKFLETLHSWNPDAIVVAAFGRILPKSLLELPAKGCLNVHGSLLPKYRGAAPIQWAVIEGETETGITIMLMDEGMDTGAILQQELVAIDPEETAGELSIRMARVGGLLLLSTLHDWLRGHLTPTAQDDSKATFAPLLKKGDGLIDWRWPATYIANRIRGLSPWPGGFTFLQGKRWGIWKVEVKGPEETSEGVTRGKPENPGTILAVRNNGIAVQTGEGILSIVDIQPENTRRMHVSDYIRGHQLAVGLAFGGEEDR